jgi:hypothetical protein
MPDELDVRDDREEAHEEGGDDEVGLNAITHHVPGHLMAWDSIQA